MIMRDQVNTASFEQQAAATNMIAHTMTDHPLAQLEHINCCQVLLIVLRFSAVWTSLRGTGWFRELYNVSSRIASMLLTFPSSTQIICCCILSSICSILRIQYVLVARWAVLLAKLNQTVLLLLLVYCTQLTIIVSQLGSLVTSAL